MRYYLVRSGIIVSFVLQFFMSSTSCEAASKLASALNFQCTELSTLTGNFQTVAANLILVDAEIELIDKTKTVLNSYVTPSAQIITQINGLVTLLTASSNKAENDPTLVTDNTQFQSMLTGLDAILNVVLASSNLCLLQTQTINFTRSNMSIQYPHYDVEWSSIKPMFFTTNTQAGNNAAAITSFLVSMNATNSAIAQNVTNLTNSRAILVSLYNNYVDQVTQYFQTVAVFSGLVVLVKK